MEPTAKTYKRKFDRELRHVKLILTRERVRLPVDEWLDLVEQTRLSVLAAPDEYFCQAIPPTPVFTAVIDHIFAGFLEDQRIRAVQTARPFRIRRPNTE